MAERRMFAKSIINSARFLRMPTSSRLLYYDLGMNADDDGVVEAFTVMRLTGAQEDDLRVLVSKGYVTVLNDELVSLINDWKTNNSIRHDRYKPSIYNDLLIKFITENQLSTECLPYDNQAGDDWETQVRLGKDRLGKDRLGKDRLENSEPETKKSASRFYPPTLDEVKAYCLERKNYVDAERFIDYYEANGWKVGKNKMKDWRAAVRTWEKNEYSSKPASKEDYRTEVSITDVIDINKL